MTLRLTFGIDPGLSGAIAALVDGEAIAIFDMPVRQATKTGTRNEVDDHELAGLIRFTMSEHPGAHISACIERVGSTPMEGRKQGGSSMFNFGDGAGVVRGVLGGLRVPYVRVIPAQWKRHFGLIGQDKDAARTLALRRFPTMERDLKRKKDGGRADALLLALWHESTEMRGNKAP